MGLEENIVIVPGKPCRRQPGRPDIRLANGGLTERGEDGMERENTQGPEEIHNGNPEREMESVTKGGERETDRRWQPGSSSVVLSCKHSGRKGRKQRKGSEGGVSFLPLCSNPLFWFHETIVASRVTLPFKGEGQRVCVFKRKGIHKSPHPPNSDSPVTRITAGETLF